MAGIVIDVGANTNEPGFPGPWWRRPLRFDDRANRRLLAFAEAARAGLGNRE